MGNCIGHESGMEWGGDYWGWPDQDEDHEAFSGKTRKEDDVAKGGGVGGGAAAAITELKVRISKRQLEELVRKREVEEKGTLSARQAVAQLLVVVGDQGEANQQTWRPALQSIPEIN